MHSKCNLQLVFTIIVFNLLCPRFCRAQGDPCQTSGRCGPFGVCESQGSPTCSCLRGFEPRNDEEWNSGNWTSGCVRRVPLGCEAVNNGTTNEDGFLKLPVTMSSGSSDRWFGPENQCEGLCLRNCSCIAYGFDSTGCGFWAAPLIGIRKSPAGSGSDLYIRVSSSELDQKKDNKKIIIILVAVGFVIISICSYLSWKWIAKHRAKRKTLELANAGASSSVDSSLQDALGRVNLEDLPLFKFETLANATNNFSEANKLGKGGFGPVYKGELANGREIAVKRLSQASGQGMQEFMNEVVLISKLQHRNLVRLLGCCVENMETMLIYEYMPNKSLDTFLFDPLQEILDWRKRFNIIEGICRGLLYLHRDSRLKIIHRDLKPSNILLDSDWNPKISDFGMARIYGTNQDHVSTVRVVGTYGYMAPEYAIEGRFSEKSDVFSFGVLMLEIATGRRNKSFHQDGSLNLLGHHNKGLQHIKLFKKTQMYHVLNLNISAISNLYSISDPEKLKKHKSSCPDYSCIAHHVWNSWNEGNVAALIDPRISSLSYQSEVMRCIHIGLLCVQELPKDRPSISAVLSMLSSDIIKLPEPKQSAFALKSSSSHIGTSSSQQSKKSSSSMNDVTLTTVGGR